MSPSPVSHISHFRCRRFIFKFNLYCNSTNPLYLLNQLQISHLNTNKEGGAGGRMANEFAILAKETFDYSTPPSVKKRCLDLTL
jgi:hypothetical protein